MKKSIKSVSAIALSTAIAISTFTLGADVNTVEAASKKQNVITQANYNSGSTVKYTYNKKGLVTKAVSTRSSKKNPFEGFEDEEWGKAKDESVKVTTTYKYNKKNKISSKTTKTVTTDTYYETDKTTGLTIKGTEGKVTETETAVTKYTYNNKGLATQAVTTTTTTLAGNTTVTKKTNALTEKKSSKVTEISDGRFIAGYNEYNADGTSNGSDENTSANVYFYDGSIASAESTTTTTTTYEAKADGTYTKTVKTDTSSVGYTKEPVELYYGEEYVNGVKTIVPLTYNEKGFEGEKDIQSWEYNPETEKEELVTKKEKFTYKYQKADGTPFNGDGDSIFSRTEKVNVVADTSATESTSKTVTSDVSDKVVTTTKYTYDNKKRVKKAVSTANNTKEISESTAYSQNSSSSTKNSKIEYTDKNKSVDNDIKVSTTTYTYDKKGRAKKVVTSNDGVQNSSSTKNNTNVTVKDIAEIFKDYDYNNIEHNTYSKVVTYTNSDGSKYSISTSYSLSDVNPATPVDQFYPTTTSITIAGGTKTETTTNNPYKITYSTSKSEADGSIDSRSGSVDVTLYGNGGSKTVNTYDEKYTSSVASANNSKTVTRTDYVFDKKSISHGYVKTTKTTSADNSIQESTSALYIDRQNYVTNTDDAKVKTEAAGAALEATGIPYNKTETKAVIATPSKTTTNYAYDKNGNVKSAKASGTSTEVKTVKDETYGNTIYEFDANGELQTKEIAVTHKFTDKDAMENTVKKGTKNLTKVYTVNTSTDDRAKSSGSLIRRATYTIKSKKASASSVVKKQQWILQNGNLNGEVGLN